MPRRGPGIVPHMTQQRDASEVRIILQVLYWKNGREKVLLYSFFDTVISYTVTSFTD